MAEQYEIKIKADASGVNIAAASVGDLADMMVSAGASSDQFDSALARVVNAMTGTEAAAASAAAELAEGEKKYGQLEAAANKAAKALERAGLKTKGAVPIDLKRNADAAAAALKLEAAALDALRTKADGAAEAHGRLTAAHSKLSASAKSTKQLEAAALAAKTGNRNMGDMASGLNALGGPLGSAGGRAAELGEAFQRLKLSFGSAKGAALGIAVAVAIVTAALIYAVVKTAVWAVGLVDAARNLKLTTDALAAQSDAFKGLSDIIPKVSKRTGIAASELVGLAKQLEAAGVGGDEMADALRAVAIAEAALGQGAAAKLVEQLKAGKKSAAELAAEMEKKFGGVVSKRLLSLEAQSSRLKSNMAGTFGGLEIEGFLESLSTMVDLFDESTASGQAMKFLFEAFFQPLIDGAAAAFPYIEAGFLGMQIAALKTYIFLKPAIRGLKEGLRCASRCVCCGVSMVGTAIPEVRCAGGGQAVIATASEGWPAHIMLRQTRPLLAGDLAVSSARAVVPRRAERRLRASAAQRVRAVQAFAARSARRPVHRWRCRAYWGERRAITKVHTAARAALSAARAGRALTVRPRRAAIRRTGLFDHNGVAARKRGQHCERRERAGDVADRAVRRQRTAQITGGNWNALVHLIKCFIRRLRCRRAQLKRSDS